MADETPNPAEIYPYLLLGAWPEAWQNYREWFGREGALPGLLLAAQARILIQNDPQITGGKYWTSALRADLNLSFWRAEAAGWITRVAEAVDALFLENGRIHWTENQYARRLRERLTPVSWLFDGFNEREVRQKHRENRPSHDWQWWLLTINGDRALMSFIEEIDASKREHEKRLRGLGFHPQP